MFQTEKFEKHFPHLRLCESRIYALNYYLDSIIPTGAVIEVIAPKEVLTTLLPAIAVKKNCKVICKGASASARMEFAHAGVLASQGISDLSLTEPDFLVEDGALIQPTHLIKETTIGIASIEKWMKENPGTHDFTKPNKIITELGVLSPENLKITLSQVL